MYSKVALQLKDALAVLNPYVQLNVEQEDIWTKVRTGTYSSVPANPEYDVRIAQIVNSFNNAPIELEFLNEFRAHNLISLIRAQVEKATVITAIVRGDLEKFEKMFPVFTALNDGRVIDKLRLSSDIKLLMAAGHISNAELRQEAGGEVVVKFRLPKGSDLTLTEV